MCLVHSTKHIIIRIRPPKGIYKLTEMNKNLNRDHWMLYSPRDSFASGPSIDLYINKCATLDCSVVVVVLQFTARNAYY